MIAPASLLKRFKTPSSWRVRVCARVGMRYQGTYEGWTTTFRHLFSPPTVGSKDQTQVFRRTLSH